MGKNKSIRVKLPREHSDAHPASVAASATQDTLFVFVGQHRDAVEVLSSRPAGEGAPPKFSVAHYLQASREITRGEELLLAMDPGGPLDAKRRRRLRIMRKAYEDQKWSDFSNNIVRKFIRETVDQIERRVSQSGHIDILQDLAFLVPYRILERFVGLPGPDHLSEMVVALQYDKRYITKLPPDWLRQRPEQAVADPAYLTAHMWSRLCFAEVIANILDKRELTGAAIQAASEMLTHIDEKIMEERLKHGTGEPDTLLKQLVRQAPDFVQPGFDENAYFAEVRAILTDLMTTISINIGLPFSKAILAALALGFDLSKFVTALDAIPVPHQAGGETPSHDGSSIAYVERFAYELLRMLPSAPAIYRRCETSTELPSGAKVNKGDWVAVLLAAASRDPRAFPEPEKFSMGEHMPPPFTGPPRDLKNYLLFGPFGGAHRCWGEQLGRLMLGELFRAAARFKGLTRVAGPLGEVMEYPRRMDYGLQLKFFPFDPNKKE
jgi:cytochrome P450